MDIIPEPLEFEWDEGNNDKNRQKHQVTNKEIEGVFVNKPLMVYEDLIHSQLEKRYYGLGKTDNDKKLFVSFTIRVNKIRVISARPMSRRERKIYEQT